MKISASTYSFAQLTESGELSQLDCIKKAADMGFDAVEFVELLPPDGEAPADYARRAAEEAKRCGIEISSLTFGANLLEGGEAEIERVKGMLDLAALLGAKFARHDVMYNLGEYRSFHSALPKIAAACREITEYGAQLGIRTMVENHGYICQDSERVEALFNAVNHPNFGILADMGNFLCADESPAAAYSRLAPTVSYAHAKDFLVKPADGSNPGRGFFPTRGGNYLRGTIIGHGAVPVKQCLQILKNAGFDGWLGLEFEGMENAEEGIAIGLENLRRYIGELK